MENDTNRTLDNTYRVYEIIKKVRIGHYDSAMLLNHTLYEKLFQEQMDDVDEICRHRRNLKMKRLIQLEQQVIKTGEWPKHYP